MILRSFLTIMVSIICLTTASYAGAVNNSKLNAIKSTISEQALKKGAKQTVIDQYLMPATIKEKAEKKNKQVKKRFKQETFDDYLAKHTSAQKNKKAAEYYKKYQAEFKNIEERTGVPGEVILTIWGLETNFGKWTGNCNTISGLLSLIYYDNPMKKYYEEDLVSFLVILSKEQNIEPYQLISSHDGGMGLIQFQPSTYLWYSARYDGEDKPANIWKNPLDGFTSIANYLSKLGWKKNTPWLYQVTIKPNDKTLIEYYNKKKYLTPDQWSKIGVQIPDQIKKNITYRLVIPKGNVKDAFLVTTNYNRFINWNPHENQAVTIGIAANQVHKLTHQ